MKEVALMYHDVVADGRWDDSGFSGAAAARYKFDEREFTRHLEALAGSGLQFPAVDNVAATTHSRCLLTFDDGGTSARTIGAALTARNMCGHFFITTSRIGSTGFVTPADLRALRRDRHVIGSHSHTHPEEISRVSAPQLDDEWRRSVVCLSDVLGESVEIASVPGGFYSDAVARAAAAAGIRILFTSEPTARVATLEACRVLGRYALWRGMPAEHALALALGTSGARERQWLAWNLKKPLKRWAGPVYRLARSHFLRDTH